jgi:hypothetical protein
VRRSEERDWLTGQIWSAIAAICSAVAVSRFPCGRGGTAETGEGYGMITCRTARCRGGRAGASGAQGALLGVSSLSHPAQPPNTVLKSASSYPGVGVVAGRGAA